LLVESREFAEAVEPGLGGAAPRLSNRDERVTLCEWTQPQTQKSGRIGTGSTIDGGSALGAEPEASLSSAIRCFLETLDFTRLELEMFWFCQNRRSKAGSRLDLAIGAVAQEYACGIDFRLITNLAAETPTMDLHR
jgi:hypothetical protein